MSAGAASASSFLQSIIQVGSHGGKAGDQPAECTGHSSKKQGERDHSPIESNLADAGQRLGHEIKEGLQGQSSQRKTQQASADAEQQAFEQGVAQKRGSL